MRTGLARGGNPHRRPPRKPRAGRAPCRVKGVWGVGLQGVWLGHPASGTRAGLVVLGACAPTAATERPKGVDPTRVVPQGN